MNAEKLCECLVKVKEKKILAYLLQKRLLLLHHVSHSTSRVYIVCGDVIVFWRSPRTLPVHAFF